jgi:hypothetical protein
VPSNYLEQQPDLSAENKIDDPKCPTVERLPWDDWDQKSETGESDEIKGPLVLEEIITIQCLPSAEENLVVSAVQDDAQKPTSQGEGKGSPGRKRWLASGAKVIKITTDSANQLKSEKAKNLYAKLLGKRKQQQKRPSSRSFRLAGAASLLLSRQELEGSRNSTPHVPSPGKKLEMAARKARIDMQAAIAKASFVLVEAVDAAAHAAEEAHMAVREAEAEAAVRERRQADEQQRERLLEQEREREKEEQRRQDVHQQRQQLNKKQDRVRRRRQGKAHDPWQNRKYIHMVWEDEDDAAKARELAQDGVLPPSDAGAAPAEAAAKAEAQVATGQKVVGNEPATVQGKVGEEVLPSGTQREQDQVQGQEQNQKQAQNQKQGQEQERGDEKVKEVLEGGVEEKEKRKEERKEVGKEEEKEEGKEERPSQVELTLVLAKSIDAIPEGSAERVTFCEQLKRDLSSAVGGEGVLEPSRIEILAISAGSIIVDMRIKPVAKPAGASKEGGSDGGSDGGSMAPARVLSELSRQLVDHGSALYQGVLTREVDGERSVKATLTAPTRATHTVKRFRMARKGAAPPHAPIPTAQTPPSVPVVAAETKEVVEKKEKWGVENALHAGKENEAAKAVVVAARVAMGSGAEKVGKLGDLDGGEDAQEIEFTFTRQGNLGRYYSCVYDHTIIRDYSRICAEGGYAYVLRTILANAPPYETLLAFFTHCILTLAAPHSTAYSH